MVAFNKAKPTGRVWNSCPQRMFPWQVWLWHFLRAAASITVLARDSFQSALLMVLTV